LRRWKDHTSKSSSVTSSSGLSAYMERPVFSMAEEEEEAE
jgi:hypothetical protein